MKKKHVLAFITLLSIAFTFAQQEASFWYFGQNAGLQFDATTGTVTAVTDGQINTLEGCTSISDTEGNLQFYTDGQTVWNRNHQIMANGDYFGGTGLLGDPSSTSSGLIVPKPQDPTQYYIFTVDEPHHQNAAVYPNQFTGTYQGNGGTVPGADDGFNNGFNYSLVDMTLNGGLGDVVDTEKNVPLVTYDPGDLDEASYKCSEKITAVAADDCSSFWVITHFTDSFYAFKVDINGVDTTPVISTVGPEVPISGYRRNALGYIKASPDGAKLGVAHYGFAMVTAGDAAGGVYLFDFDNDTGVVSNSVELYGPENNTSPYGVEFSAENRKVYATVGNGANGGGTSSLLQWDLESDDIPGSIQTISTSNSLSAGALQLGLDRRIYRAQVSFANFATSGTFLGVINNPEATGAAVGYVENGILLDINGGFNNLSRIGLPPFIQSLFNSQIDIIQNGISTTELKLCTNDTYTLMADDIPGADYTWFKDDVELTETTFELFVDEPGFYEVFIEPNNGECPIEGEAVVNFFEFPTATQPDDIIICDPTGTSDVDLTTQNDAVLNGQNTLQYTVRYYNTLEDADNNVNEIIDLFGATEGVQTIVVRVENFENPNCYVTTTFDITVFITPEISSLDDIVVCDTDFTGNSMDGFTTIDLEELNTGILGTQDETLYTISYHPTQDDADNNTNPLDLNYTNTTANSEEIFVRIENNANTDCYSTDSFVFTINNAPEAFDSTIIQCDEDGIPEGFTLFDLNQAFEDITGGATDRTINFYVSLADLENDEDELNADTFENYFNPQVIFALVTNTTTGCTNIAELTLQASTTASNNAVLEECDYDGNEDGFTSFNLNDATDTVLFGLPPNLNVTYYETYENALLEDSPLGLTFTNTIPYNQTIYARVENVNDCYGVSEIQLTVFELPNIEIQETLYYCLNSFPETITLTGGLIDDIPNNYYYEWSTGEDEFEIEVNEPGTYTVRVTSTDGCFKDRTITVLPSDIATITDIEVTDATENNTITVFVTGEGVYEYALDDINGPYQESNVFEDVTFGFHTIYVRDIENNCGIVDELVSVIGFPKFFTPNGDEYNQYWQVKGISSDFQPNSQILIFDRYGKLLVELDPLGPGWDGTFNGANMPASDYWFVVTLEDGRTFQSHFALKR
ncbi:T9SS type B sorting domain-containing protein [Psychroserpens sp.]|uniref:T9SS type B sorting domain-containing protein n=1 Tax=Psychroserpens sp. TaxID=2020870 RepID=UPI001B245B32|nr:T9SS type B sorting domain-containing protein [Psychroserpens sp.]MBO6607165.1 T9SS type B sorting domain-containing protein [Psychroserpens sp.]MBO6654311.1 T9SS type B sorting domain-containing protein [Psychroserpens sp.]MBO6682403.1 T9SS type B sorting domain-containing protein [Psychroserpens sp.]MBO6750937.1 T9SS type B sorting domain-containing protein [Psychroserpens sp.]MBO6915634.1 T9SS type B sorting domain-containing protein [Psychroserpens sp.]